MYQMVDHTDFWMAKRVFVPDQCSSPRETYFLFRYAYDEFLLIGEEKQVDFEFDLLTFPFFAFFHSPWTFRHF